ncbi:UNVERIFIED_CONTAM: hypothetical protein Scaly_0076800 [Sesamum calycinum]|uniref:Endonuclease/exonuclease/phosphatase domain-containing protein n=1 Tax=Sesamum calycinum TaxID=2727403 RepID=A0AAW2SVF8_9LAMI
MRNVILEAITPIFNKFQSLVDSDSLLELDPELQPQVQAEEQKIHQNVNITSLESNLQEHTLEDSVISNWLKRNNSIEDNSVKRRKAASLAFILFPLIFLTKFGALLSSVLMFRNPMRALWEELKRLSLNKVPWIVGGDFNTMLHTHENRGGTINNLGSIEDVNDMVLDSRLTDARFEGEPFTWSNKRVSRRVDRTEDKVPSSFRFQHMWIMHPNFHEMVKQPWSAPIQGYRTKPRLLAANEAKKQFDRLPSKANLINLNRQNVALVHALNLESEFWRQKVTANGLKLEKGTQNSFIPQLRRKG